MEELLKISLSAAVPLWIKELQQMPWKDILKISQESATLVASQGDTLMYKTKGKTRETFNALARGLAALSFAPGGVKFLGMHFEARHGRSEESTGGTVPRNLTFEKGSLGRFILTRRLRLEWQEAPPPPGRASSWAPGTRHFLVRIIDADGREMSSYFSQGPQISGPPELELVLYGFGLDAILWESSHGSIDTFASELSADPDDPEAQYGFAASESQAAALRVLLGKEGYQELLEIVSQGQR